MDKDGMQCCRTCPAYCELPGEGGAGTCRAGPPTALQSQE